MPPPEELQFRVELTDGSATVADFAWPSAKVLLFVDGLSRALHGNAAMKRADGLKRARCRMLGYLVLETSAESLLNAAEVDALVEELSVYLTSY
jgi:very-short-patch-repair endonuclease